VLIVAIVLAVNSYIATLPFEATVNGIRQTFGGGGGGTKIDDIMASGLVTPKYGNLIAVDGSVLEFGGGERYTIELNGAPCEDTSKRLWGGDDVVVTDGADVMEENTYTEKVVPFKFELRGVGAFGTIIHRGADGVERTSHGTISGKTFTGMEKPVQNKVAMKYNPATEDKVMALTFDDGPGEFTRPMLDVLDEVGVKATFFELGENVDAYPELSAEVVTRGHQLAMHGYAHDDMAALGTAAVRDNVLRCRESILAATGLDTGYFRAPYGDFTEREWKIAGDTFSYLVGWNIDTVDWQGESVSAMQKNIIDNARPGRIVLMHDGGGNRQTTVDLVRKVVPKLKAKGWSFVTIEQLSQMKPPAAEPLDSPADDVGAG
jgi:peptidoglycan/xylan/chitin deacetylase (PgdA/CDA1 family)